MNKYFHLDFLKSPKLKKVVKWLLGIFIAIFSLIFLLNIFASYLIINLLAFSNYIIPKYKDGYINYMIKNERPETSKFFADNVHYTFDPKTGGPDLRTIAAVTDSNKPYTDDPSNVYMRHFYADLKPYGGTSDSISTYVVTSEIPDAAGEFNQPFVFIIHGFESDWGSSFHYAEIYLKMHYNVVIWNNQGVSAKHKDAFGYYGSKGGYNTFGIKESQDTNAMIQWFEQSGEAHFTLDGTTFKPYYSNQNVLVSGISLGATTALYFAVNYCTEANINRYKLKGVIEDSGYADLVNEFMWVGSHGFHMPSSIIRWGFCFWYENLTGLNPYNNSIIHDLDKLNSNLKVLLIHTNGDDYVPFEQNFKPIRDTAIKYDKHISTCVINGKDHVYTLDYQYYTYWHDSTLNWENGDLYQKIQEFNL